MRFLLTNEYGRYNKYALMLVAVCICGTTHAQETQATTDAVDDAASTEQTVEAPEPEREPSPCFPTGRRTRDEDDKWIDTIPEKLYTLTCSPVSWVDGLFGNDRFDDEYQNTHGHITLGGLWDERSGFHRITRAKVRVYAPQISERFNAFIGRIDEDDFFLREEESGSNQSSSSQPSTVPTPEAFDRNIDDSTLLGLGYNEPLKKRGSFDADVGVRVRFPVDPYVRGSYRYAMPLGERNLMRFRETIFWQETEGFGTTTRLDWDRVLTDNFFTRLSGSGTFSQNTIGMRWYSTFTLYQVMRHQRVLAYELKSYGATDSEVPLQNYGATIIYRRSAWRDWFWIELRTGIDWPRYVVAEKRTSNLNAGLTFELRYFKPK
jgi:hypothetical protein